VTTQIVAMGGYEIDGPFGPPSKLEEYIFAAAGKTTPRVCFLPTASSHVDFFLERWNEITDALPCDPCHIELFERTVDDLDAFLADVDVVYVAGGNTANLLAIWRAHGLDAAFARRAGAGDFVVGGASAGAMCWFEGGLTDSYGTTHQPLHGALGWLPGTFCPHFGAHERRRSYRTMVADGDLAPGYGVDDGAALHFVDGELTNIVRAKADANAYRVDERGQHALEL
jgi:dipeptidase E